MGSTSALRVAAPVVLGIVIVEAVVSIDRRWPHHFGGVGDPTHMMSGFVSGGTALAPPLFMIVVLALLCIGLRLTGRWRLGATVLMVPLAAGMTVGSVGEMLARDTDVPVGVRWGAGVLAVSLSLLLLILAVASLAAGRTHHSERTTIGKVPLA